MADNSKLELVVEVDVNKANASIKSVNTGLSSMEQAASKAAHGASAGIDGMTTSMVKGAAAGNLIAESIKKALEWAKEWTIEAANHAAHTDKMGMSMIALAKAHGVAEEAATKSVEAVKKVGFSTEDAIHAVDRLMISDMNLSKAEGLAKVAKDAAAIENITPGEALEKLLMAIESGASRGLRTMGIFVDLNKEVDRQEKLTGKTLDENEIRQLRYNAVMREAAKIQGAAAAASGSAEAQSKALAREVNELREVIGEKFQGYLRSWVGHLRDLVGFLRDNSDWLVKFAQGVMLAAGILATYALATKIMEIGAAVEGLTAVLALNPWALLITGVVASGAIIYKTWSDTQANLERGYEDMRRKAIQKDLFSGKLKLDDVKKMGYTDDQTREIVSGRRMLPGESRGDFGGPKLNVKIGGKPELSDAEVDRIATERKKQGEAEKQATDYYMRAVEERKSAEHDQARARIDDSMKIIQATQSETTAAKESLNVVLLSIQEREAGLAKIREEERREITARSTYVDDKSGQVRQFALAPATLEKIHAATRERIAAFEMKFNEEEAGRLEEMWKAMGLRQRRMFEQFVLEPMKLDLEIWSQSFDLDEKRKDAQLGVDRSAVQQRTDLARAQLEAVDAVTLRDKIAVEQMKTAIEVDALKQRTAIELQEIDRRTEADIRAAERAMQAKGIFDDARQDQIRNRIRQSGQDEKDALQKNTASEVDLAQLQGATQTRHMVTDQYRSIFDSLKQQAGGVFDALLTKSQSIWSAIGNSLKTALLTAIKDVVSSRVAAMLMQLFTGTNVTLQQGGLGGGGIMGKLGGVLGIGAVPVFGGGGPIPGGAAGGWGTPPFLPNVGSGPGGLGAGGTPPLLPTGSAGGGLLSKSGLTSFLPGLKSFLGITPSVAIGPGMATTWEAATMGQKLSSIGKSNAALMGGAMLAMDGLRRGGKLGLLETTGGGALIGFKYGGAVGAAIGAGVGAVAGLVRMLFKGRDQKIVDEVRGIYGVTIDKQFAGTLVEQSRGQDLRVFLRSPQIREQIEAYAMMTNQRMGVLDSMPRGVSLEQRSGTLYQAGGYVNNQLSGYSSSLPNLGNLSVLQPAASQPVTLSIKLDGQATSDIMEGKAVEVIASNPRAVQASAAVAMRSSFGRRDTARTTLDPFLVTG